MPTPSPDRDALERLLAELPEDERLAARPILAAMLAARRTTNESAAQERGRDLLRNRITQRIDADTTSSSFSMKTLFSGVLGFAVALLIVGGYFAFNRSDTYQAIRGVQLARTTQQVRQLPDQAFDGDLSGMELVDGPGVMMRNDAPLGAAPARDSVAPGVTEQDIAPHAPEGTTAMPDPKMAPPAPMPSATGGGSVGMGGSADMRIAPEFYNPPETRYKFTGGALADVPAKLAVYQVDLEKQQEDAADAGLPLMRLFGARTDTSARLQRFTVNGGGEKGYIFEYDLLNGTVSAYRDWARWNTVDGPGKIYPATPPQPPQLPDTDAIRIAQEFLDAHGVSTVGLEAPRVDDTWKRYLPAGTAAAADPMYTMPYQPSPTVLFGKSFDGRKLLNWEGQPDGYIRVMVSATDRAVEGMNGWLPVPLAASNYPAVSSSDAVERAKKGGINRPWWGPAMPELAGQKRPVVTVTLTEMTLGYTQRQLQGTTGMATYFVPIYVFTGTRVDEFGSSSPASIIVPAITGEFFRDEERMIKEQEEELRYEVGIQANEQYERFAEAYVRALLRRDFKTALEYLTPGAKAEIRENCQATPVKGDVATLEASGELADMFSRCTSLGNERLVDSSESVIRVEPTPGNVKLTFTTKRDGKESTVRVTFEQEGVYIPATAVHVFAGSEDGAPFTTDTWRFPNYGRLDGGAVPMPYPMIKGAPTPLAD